MSSLIQSSSSASMSQLRVSEACDGGKKFAELFYEKLDKSRHTMGSLFHDSATLVWNGNVVNGKSSIVTFYEKLPTVETIVLSIDAQPILESAILSQTMITIVCCGKMKFSSSPQKSFSEAFMLTAENNVWKVVSDTYRNY